MQLYLLLYLIITTLNNIIFLLSHLLAIYIVIVVIFLKFLNTYFYSFHNIILAYFIFVYSNINIIFFA